MDITYRALGEKFDSLREARAFVSGYLSGTENPPPWGVKVFARCGRVYHGVSIAYARGVGLLPEWRSL